ncbi:MAG: DNA polymerase I [Lysinibacillus sp.]
MKIIVSKWLQNIGIASIIASLFTLYFRQTGFTWVTKDVFHIPLFFVLLFLVSLVIAEDIRNTFKKVFWYEQRPNKRPIWQLGVGKIFFLAQISFVMVFATQLTRPELGGMPLFLVFAFLNAFIMTVIYEEIFYDKSNTSQ